MGLGCVIKHCLCGQVLNEKNKIRISTLLLLDKGQILTECKLFHSFMHLPAYDIYSSKDLPSGV